MATYGEERNEVAKSSKSWNKKQLRMARKRNVVVRANGSNQQFHRAVTKKKDFIEALKGTGGILSAIAQNLGAERATVKTLLQRPDWVDVKAAWEDECEAGRDAAEETIRFLIAQRLDYNVAGTNARWYLEKLVRDRFGDVKTLNVEASHTVKTLNVNVDLNDLIAKLPIETQRQILETLDVQEEETRVKRLEAERQLVNQEAV